jgi:hypothetical protein
LWHNKTLARSAHFSRLFHRWQKCSLFRSILTGLLLI